MSRIVHDTLTDFYLQRDQFDGSKGSLRSYLITIADRKAIRKYWENQRQWVVSELSRMGGGRVDKPGADRGAAAGHTAAVSSGPADSGIVIFL